METTAQPETTTAYTVHVATLDDGSQILVTRFMASGKVTIATRPDKYATWGIPYTAEDMTWKG
jgi:DNA-binding IclR family transcriptional regulator